MSRMIYITKEPCLDGICAVICREQFYSSAPSSSPSLHTLGQLDSTCPIRGAHDPCMYLSASQSGFTLPHSLHTSTSSPDARMVVRSSPRAGRAKLMCFYRERFLKATYSSVYLINSCCTCDVQYKHFWCSHLDFYFPEHLF